MFTAYTLRILLSDGTGLTSRQAATQAAAAGHHVEAVAPSRLGPASFTRHVRRVHRVPAFGVDPEAWLEATLAVLATGGHDVLLPTQEQVALLARDADRVRALGVALAVPPFDSLVRVQDKVAQAATLSELDLPHPDTWIARSAGELLEASPPVYLKSPVGTASHGVLSVTDRAGLERAASELKRSGELDWSGGIVVQQALRAPLAMVQAVFDDGRLLAWHACLREREGARGGSAVKRSVAEPAIAEHLRLLGEELSWHGALSLDALLTADGPRYIDINPRLVEPGNAWRAGVDLVGALLAISLGERVPETGAGRPGVRTHQLLIGVLGAAEHGRGRRGIAAEIANALAHRGPYVGSAEELTPVSRDPLAALPVAFAAVATLARPASYRWFTDGAVSAYALSPAAWDRIRSGAPAPCRRPAPDAGRAPARAAARSPAAG